MVQNTYFRTNADNMQANLTNQLLEVSDTSQQGQADCYLSLSDSLYGIQAEIYAIAKNLPSTGIVSLFTSSFIYKNDWTSAGGFSLDYDCDTNEFIATFDKQTSSGTETTTNRYSVSDVITANREFEIYLTFMNNDGYFDINRELDKPEAYRFDSPVYISLMQLRSNTQSEELVYRLDSSFEFEGESPASFTLLDMFPPVMSGSTNSKFTAASEPNLDTLSFQIADIDTLPKTITAPSGVDGYSEVTVDSIQNLEAINIKNGVKIAGVTGSLNEFRPTQKAITIATDATFPVTYYPEGSANGFSEFGINGITNLEASNIKEGVTIAGVTGNVVEANLTSYSTMLVSGSTFPWTITPDSPYNGFSEVSIAGIDYLEPENIKAGVTICNVTGTYSGSTPTLVTKNITENGTYSASSDSADGYSSVTVNVSGGGSSKYGVSIDNFIGDVDSNGVLSSPSSINGITFTGVTEIGYGALFNIFYNKRLVSGLISFPNLTTVEFQGLQDAFSYNQLTSVDLSSLTTVDSSGLNSAFSNNQITSVDLSSLTTIGDNGLGGAFYNNQITSIDLSSLTTISGDSGVQSAFSNNQITSVDLSNLTTISNSGLNGAFSNNQITSVSLPVLTTVNSSGLASAFYNNQITSVSLPVLTTVGLNGLDNAFAYNHLININFPNLEHLDNYALANAFAYNGTLDDETGLLDPSLQSVSFPALTSQSFIGLEEGYREYFQEMLTEGLSVTVHFPSNLQSVIGDWDDVTNGFGGSNTTVLFDLPATE